MNSPEQVLRVVREGRLDYPSAAARLASQIDSGNLEQVMRSLPSRLTESMRIEAGRRRPRPQDVLYLGFRSAESIQLDLVRDGLERNGHAVVWEEDGS